MHTDLLALTLKLVVGRLIGILKTAPSADIINKDGAEIGRTVVHDAEEILKRFTSLNAEPAFSGVRESSDDNEPVVVSVALDGGMLIFRRVLLMFR
jgi:hypothetical protein